MMENIRRYIEDVFGNNDSYEFRRDIGIDNKFIPKNSIQATYMINPKRITIRMPYFSTPYYIEDSNYIGEAAQSIITFEPKLSAIAAASAAATEHYSHCSFAPYINKIIDIGVKCYERRYGTIRN